MSNSAAQLYAACQEGHIEIVLALLAAGAVVNQADNDGGTPQHFACFQGHAQIVVVLLAAGAAVNQANNNSGFTPLCAACQEGHAEIVAALLAAGAAVNQADNDGHTPLYAACDHSHAEVVTVLLAAGAAVNQAASDGEAPLSIACHEGDAEVVSALLTAGAAVNQADNNGNTPLSIACHVGHLACVRLLSSFGASRMTLRVDVVTAAEVLAANAGHEHIAAWLLSSRQWSTPLHHLDTIDPPRARTLLRTGADLHAQVVAGAPTPLSLAQAMHTTMAVPDGSAADLVLRAGQRWSPQTHALFPAASRAWAVELLLTGHRLSRESRFEAVAGGLLDAWMAAVVPHAVQR